MSALATFVTIILPTALAAHVLRNHLAHKYAVRRRQRHAEQQRRLRKKHEAEQARQARRDAVVQGHKQRWGTEAEFVQHRERLLEQIRANHYSETLSRQMAEALRGGDLREAPPIPQPPMHRIVEADPQEDS